MQFEPVGRISSVWFTRGLAYWRMDTIPIEATPQKKRKIVYTTEIVADHASCR